MRDPVNVLVGWVDEMRAEGIPVTYDGFGGVSVYADGPDTPTLNERGDDWVDGHLRAFARWRCHLRHQHEQLPAA